MQSDCDDPAECHTVIFSSFPSILNQKRLYKLINQDKKKKWGKKPKKKKKKRLYYRGTLSHTFFNWGRVGLGPSWFGSELTEAEMVWGRVDLFPWLSCIIDMASRRSKQCITPVLKITYYPFHLFESIQNIQTT